MKPFARIPGRDVSKDRPATCDVARFYYEQRFTIAEDAAPLRQLIAAVDWPNALGPAQWAQWYIVALGFAPDLILELGRGYGNSTALFTQAARRIGRTRVVSLCQSGDWAATAALRIARVVDKAWFASLEVRRMDILGADHASILADHARGLVFWDAHGFEIAELVLGDILPCLAGIICSSCTDNRYAGMPRSYSGQPLWKGSKWQ